MTDGETHYLGDGLYAEFDGHGFTLYAERPSGRHYVYLEPDIARLFAEWTAKVLKELEQ